MKYVIAWHSMNPEKSTARFLAKGHGLNISGIKILESLHVVGDTQGFIVAEVSDAAALHGVVASWDGVVSCSVYPVIDDAQATRVLAASGQ
jgi:Protein of unknown function (DUF3303)